MVKSTRMLLCLLIAGPSPLVLGALTVQKTETAHEALARLTPRAREWQADAVLTNLSTFEASADGSAGQWSATFYSPASKKWLSLTASAGKLDALEVSRGLTDPIKEFIDSDRAIQVAQQNGLDIGKKPMMGLAFMGGTKDGLACWTVGGGFEPGSVGIVLNATSGAFITRHEVP